MKIGIVIIATNAYFALGVRFIKKFVKFYKGKAEIIFHVFSDTDPTNYLPAGIDIDFHLTNHTNWVEGTNSKFSNILESGTSEDYLYYFDADTNIDKDFTEEWFLGEMVGGEHYANNSFMKETKGFDRYPNSKAYVPIDTKLPQTYYYGAFFGGTTYKMRNFCLILQRYQSEDKKIGYEPGVNDESYINKYFHFNPPTRTIPCIEFRFLISDKAGLGETRNTKLDINQLKKDILDNKDKDWDIRNGKLILTNQQ